MWFNPIVGKCQMRDEYGENRKMEKEQCKFKQNSMRIQKFIINLLVFFRNRAHHIVLRCFAITVYSSTLCFLSHRIHSEFVMICQDFTKMVDIVLYTQQQKLHRFL